MRLGTGLLLSLWELWLQICILHVFSSSPILCLGCSKVHGDAEAIANRVEAFRSSMGRPPKGPQELVDSGHLRFMPRDPWRRPYRLSIDPYHAGLLIGSYGRDGKPGGRFDHSDWLHWMPLSPSNLQLPDLWLLFPARYGAARDEPYSTAFPLPPSPPGTLLPL